MKKYIIAHINAEDMCQTEVIDAAVAYEQNGADGLYLYNYISDEKMQEAFLKTVKLVQKQVDVPIFIGCYIKRFEDVKKALYTGATYVVARYDESYPKDEIQLAIERFGKDKLIALLSSDSINEQTISELVEHGVAMLMVELAGLCDDKLAVLKDSDIPVIGCGPEDYKACLACLKEDITYGVVTKENADTITALKSQLYCDDIDTVRMESNIAFSELKKGADGLVPVVVQDYRTQEVLMVAYMNEESYNMTIETGRMTYYSRSRNELWIKGETSGHYQFLKHLTVDCDKDTLLAKVHQLGAACHTGNPSCFFTTVCKKDYNDLNPLTVLNEDFNIIMERKLHPKEGSYTNYLFDKGIDKILKKCGEEATEITIAAKNPDAEELKYEIADYLYHLMVLMAECDLDWNDIVKELANRRKS